MHVIAVDTRKTFILKYSTRCKHALTEKFAVVTLYSYFPALLDQTIKIDCELVSNVKASVTMDLQPLEQEKKKAINETIIQNNLPNVNC